MLFWIAGFCLISQAQAQLANQVAGNPITARANQMVPVTEEVRLIEEEGLPLDPTLQTGSQVPSGMSASSRSVAAFIEDTSAKDNGMKLYRFTLAPGETLATKVLCEPADEVTQRFGLLSGATFTPSTDSKARIARTNRLSRQQRTTRLEFKNSEPRPFPLMLIVYGSSGHPYKIQISREPAK
jgi:hypothetical protein